MKHPSLTQQAQLAPFFIVMLFLTACGVKPVLGQTSTIVAPSISPTLAFPPVNTPAALAPTNAVQSTQAAASQTGDAAVVNVTQLNVRTGPGLTFAVANTLNQGASLVLVGKSTDGNWYLVHLSDGSAGWVFSAYVTSSANLAVLPVMQAPTAVNATTSPSTGGTIPLTGATPAPAAVPSVVVPPPANANPVVVAIANNQAQVTLSNFPAGKSVTATVGALGTSKTFKISGPTTDSLGSASFSFSMPFSWPDGTPLTQQNLYITVTTTDGSFSRTLSFPFYSGR
ncbi:MAG: SH3 domain-containing protein [Anaerolineaceae bacterium]|nr:SH3 domain-containing protein [Anaerolineaceae bacterium]